MPECGYIPGIEDLLAQAGIRYFIVAAHGFLNALLPPKSAVYAPVKLSNGVAVFGRDWETSHQVWSRLEGYPGDPVYWEFYRDIRLRSGSILSGALSHCRRQGRHRV
ncbi:MAG TPA: hypothetical protein ENM97_01025 [Moorella mulderi]|nr:hypothetical protein [Moorella mulderi]